MNALRLMPVNEQVGLLFVALFGVLTLVSIRVLWLTLREEPAQHSHGGNGGNGSGGADSMPTLQRQERDTQMQRDLRAVWVGTLVFWVSWISGAVGATLTFAVFSFLALREFVTLLQTRRSDHRSLLLAFFVALPLQYLLVGLRAFDFFTVFVPVFVFGALPVVAALAGDPERFLSRNAEIQWGIMVCVFGLSHAPALLLLNLPQFEERGAFLLFFLVMVVALAHIAQELASRRLRRRPVVRQIDRSFSFRAWALGVAAAAALGAALFWITPVNPLQAALAAAVAGGCGTLGDLVMRAMKKDAGVRYWGNRSSVTGAVGLLDRLAPLCFAAPVFFYTVRWTFV